jgi:polyphosphate kinase 2 (PPK2 family)
LAKKHKNDKHVDDVAADSAEAKKARNKAYEKEIARLQVEIASLQSWCRPRARGSSSC